MTNNQKETTVQNRNGDERIVKRNWWKIIIIVFVVLVVAIGLSVGLYYAFRPKFSLNGDYETAKPKIISEDIRDGGNEGNIGVYFYSKDDESINWLEWDDVEGEKGEYANEGPLAQVVIDSDNTYYAIEIEEDSDDMNDILLDLFMNEDSAEDYRVLYDEFETISDSSLGEEFNTPTYYPTWAWADGYPEAGEDVETTSKEFEIKTTKKEEKKKTTYEYDFVDSSTQERVTINPGTILWFDGNSGRLQNVVTGFTAPSHDDSTYSNARNNLVGWFEYFDEFKFEPHS